MRSCRDTITALHHVVVSILLTAVIAGVAHGKRYPITFKDGFPTEPFIQVAVEVGTPTTDRQVECMIRQIDLAQHHSTSCSATANQPQTDKWNVLPLLMGTKVFRPRSLSRSR